MPSPFPGMNPYLEQDDTWHDFHEKFLPALAEKLVPQVRPRYIVKLDEHVYLHELPPEPRRLAGRADVLVGHRIAPGAAQRGVGVLEPPVHVRLPAHDVERVAFLEVRDRRNRELVTVVELLSPSNKRPGADRERYLAKREALLEGCVHLVEIDLLRGGRPLPSAGRPECDYSVLVSRAPARPDAGSGPFDCGSDCRSSPSPCAPPRRRRASTSRRSWTPSTTPPVTNITSTRGSQTLRSPRMMRRGRRRSCPGRPNKRAQSRALLQEASPPPYRRARSWSSARWREPTRKNTAPTTRTGITESIPTVKFV